MDFDSLVPFLWITILLSLLFTCAWLLVYIPELRILSFLVSLPLTIALLGNAPNFMNRILG